MSIVENSFVFMFLVLVNMYATVSLPVTTKQEIELADEYSTAPMTTNGHSEVDVISATISASTEVWTPADGRNIKEWAECGGLDCDEWRRAQDTIAQLDHLLSASASASSEHTSPTSNDVTTARRTTTAASVTSLSSDASIVQSPSEDSIAFLIQADPTADASTATTARIPLPQPEGHEGHDILLTAEQASELLEEAKKMAEAQKTDGDHVTGVRANRLRRKVVRSSRQLWDLPITYKFDGQHADDEKQSIRAAFHHWEKNTCVRFTEVDPSATVSNSHLLITKSQPGCSSFVGKSPPSGNPVNPQMINLASSCLAQLGVAVHEIGHALGMWHEHQRVIRDKYIDVRYENVANWAAANFQVPPPSSVTDYGLPYDVNSVMHYSSQVGASKSDANTIVAKDSWLQRNIGQRDSLSFFDAKAINLAYCQGTCSSALPLECANGGYLDPNDCSRCRCPDGLGGKLCDQPAESNSPFCGNNLIELGINDRATISTPGYSNNRPYDNNLQCNYLITVPAEGQIIAEFVDDFHVNSPLQTCLHWVEIRYKTDLSLPGPRLCGDELPKASFRSEGDKVLVTFRSPYAAPDYVNRRGFKLRIRSVWKN